MMKKNPNSSAKKARGSADNLSIYRGRAVDPLFDGHLEKPLSQMSPREKIYYLWLQMEFRWQVRHKTKWLDRPSK